MRSGGMIVRLRYSPNSRPSERTGVPTSVARAKQVDGALVEAEVVRGTDHGAVLNHVDAVAREPGHEQGRRVDLPDVPQAGEQEPPLGARHHVVDASRCRARHSAARGCRRRAPSPRPTSRRRHGGSASAPGRRRAASRCARAASPSSKTETSELLAAVATNGVHVSARSRGSLESVKGRVVIVSPTRVPPPSLEKTVRPSSASWPPEAAERQLGHHVGHARGRQDDLVAAGIERDLPLRPVQTAPDLRAPSPRTTGRWRARRPRPSPSRRPCAPRG